jgi:hypothetical protein
MRMYVKALVVLCLLAVALTPVHAQMLPLGFGVDSSLRLEYLFGSQVIGEGAPVPDHFDRFKFSFAPRVPLLSGTVEVTPLPWASGRIAGSVTAFETDREISRSTTSVLGAAADTGFGVQWTGKPNYTSWEAAGLLHLWNAGGYRFSATSGFLRRTWEYRGATEDPNGTGSSRDVFISQIPFLGLQTAMYFPLWKARFEVLGSPFMTKTVTSSIVHLGHSAHFHTKANRGGFLELQMQGTTSITPNILCGLTGRFTYEELLGRFDATVDSTPLPSMEAQMNETLGVVGLDLTLLF